jgi:hypothetical protein
MLHFFLKLRNIWRYQIIGWNLSLSSSNLFFLMLEFSFYLITDLLARCFVVAFFSRQRISKSFFLNCFSTFWYKKPLKFNVRLTNEFLMILRFLVWRIYELKIRPFHFRVFNISIYIHLNIKYNNYIIFNNL